MCQCILDIDSKTYILSVLVVPPRISAVTDVMLGSYRVCGIQQVWTCTSIFQALRYVNAKILERGDGTCSEWAVVNWKLNMNDTNLVYLFLNITFF